MKKTICIIPGDGIGPEVMAEAEKAKSSDAILFGSVGGPVDKILEPKWKDAEKTVLLGLRKMFGLSINLRPVQVYPMLKNFCPLKENIIADGVDILFVRELTGGIYFGEPREIIEIPEGKKASDTMVYSTPEIQKVTHAAFRAAKVRGKKVTSVDKANVLACSILWREVVDEVAKEYPDIHYEHMLVDNAVMQIIKNPAQFDVILTPNMFGDILSDAGSVLPGSLGLMPSASLGDSIHMYEPAGGSAPDIAGKGIANPIAQIMSAAMMLKYSFSLNKEYETIDNAVKKFLQDGYRTEDLYEEGCTKVSTKEVGDKICENF